MAINHKSAAIALALLFTFSASAEDFRCGTHIIEEGLTKTEVLQRCGAPATQFGSQWVYDFGPDKFKILLHFDGDDEVERIDEELQEKLH
jgi:hypothetical protein